mgnify:CR=1 FL=1
MMIKEKDMNKTATHVLYRSDFRDSAFWDMILEMHGIEQSEEDGIQYDEITIRATLEDYI